MREAAGEVEPGEITEPTGLDCEHQWVVQQLREFTDGFCLVGRCARCNQQRETTLAYSYVMQLMAVAQRALDRALLDSDTPK